LQSFRSHKTVIVHVLTGLGFTDGEVYVCAAPMTHGAGSFILPTLAVGGKVVIEHSTEPAQLLNALDASAATAIWVPPTLLNMMIHEQRTAPRPLKHLRHVIFGGAPTAPERIEEGRKVFGDVLETTYGQTEASTIATALRASEMADERVRYSAGRACLLSRVAVMAPDGALLPPGESGEIVVSGDLVMNGYMAMPEESAKTLVDGWLHTGDIGYLDERGYLFVRDRIRDVVISGGFNVYPSDVEAALGKHPAVHEAVVFGVPDSHWGERVEAAVELRPGMTAAENELIAFMKELIGSVKTPKRVHIVELLPRSPVGKVLRREAKAMFSGT
jgi:fatty-acyl-CoA synthase